MGQAGSYAPKTVCSKNGAVVGKCVWRKGVLNQTKKKNKTEFSNQRSWGSDRLATKDKFEDGRFIGPHYLSPF